jgi:hypothetical protein
LADVIERCTIFSTMPTAHLVAQRAALRHEATGWFVCHAGWNRRPWASAFGSRAIFGFPRRSGTDAGTRRILWPFIADQPGNTALLNISHEVVFELVSVRQGVLMHQPRHLEGKEAVDFSIDDVRMEAPMLRGELEGTEGNRVRANTERLGAEFDKLRYEGRSAHRELQRLVQIYLITGT